MLVAPRYPSAASFEQPAALPYELSLGTVSLGELMENAAAWDIVMKHLPQLKLMVGSSMIKPQLRNMTVRGLMSFMPDATPENLKSVDAELSRLPRPAPGTP